MVSQRPGELQVDHDMWPVSQLIGRQSELALIIQQFTVVRTGHDRVVLLVGEPGIGKTRLLDEFTLYAKRNGAIVLRGSAFEAEGMPAYLPFLEAIGHYIRVTPWERLQKQIAHAPQTLLSLFPELAVYLDDAASSLSLPLGQARLRLYQAIGLFLEHISDEQPLVLMIDDLHWVDSASLDLLCYITRHHARARIFIIGAYREGEINRNQALEHTLTELIRQRMLTTITIEPLSHAETEGLAINYLGGSISSDVSLLLYNQSEGNPFFAEELIRGWVATKVLLHDGASWFAPALLECTLPSSIIGALRQRFALLSPETIGHLRIAAIIGRTFDLALLAAVAEKEMESLEEQLVEAERTRLVRLEQAGTYIFNHDNIRACLYAEVSASRRRRLHATIGHLLEERYQKENAKSAYELAAIAFHFTHAGDTTRSMAYTQQASEQALQTLAVEESSVGRSKLVARYQEQHAYPWLALLLSSQGFWREAEQAVTKSHPLSSPESLSLLQHTHGFLAYQQEDYTTAEHHFRAAKTNCHNSPTDFLLSSSLLGMTLAVQGKDEEAGRTLSELELSLNGLVGSDVLTASITACMALTAIALGDQRRLELLYPKLLEARGQQYLFLADRVLGEVCITRGDWDTALIHLGNAEEKARRHHLQPELARTLLARGTCEAALGDVKSLEDAAHNLTTALCIFKELDMTIAVGRVLSLMDKLTHIGKAPSTGYSASTAHGSIPRQQALPAHLTQSEARVLKLVVEGRRNRQIAEKLGISEKTVANHLSHIFSKTTSENRAAAVAFAIHHGLA